MPKSGGKKPDGDRTSAGSETAPLKNGARRAVYAGTFDPITNGHQDIITRAATIFDEVIVAVVEESKKRTLFSGEERRALVQEVVALMDPTGCAVRVELFSGLLVDYVRERGCNVVVRGLRAVSDYEYEAQMAIINRHLAPDVETVFLMTSDHCSFISSSVVREIARNRGDVSGLVPPPVVARLEHHYPKRD